MDKLKIALKNDVLVVLDTIVLDSKQNSYLTCLLNEKFEKNGSWGLIFLYLNKISNENQTTRAVSLATNIELFILLTDCLDDMIDLDKMTIFKSGLTVNNLFTYIKICLERIQKQVSKQKYELFMYYVDSAFLGIYTAAGKKLSPSMTEKAYLGVIAPSINLFQATVVLCMENSFAVADFCRNYAISAQIRNDLSGIMSQNYTDFYTKQLSLPIVIAYQVARNLVNEKITSLLEGSIDKKSSTLIHNFLKTNCIVEYCRYREGYYYTQSIDCLKNAYPDSTNAIHAFICFIEGEI